MSLERLDYLRRPPAIVAFFESTNYYREKMVHELKDARREDGVLKYNVTFTKFDKETGEPIPERPLSGKTSITVSEKELDRANYWIADATTPQCGRSIVLQGPEVLGLTAIALTLADINLDAAKVTRQAA